MLTRISGSRPSSKLVAISSGGRQGRLHNAAVCGRYTPKTCSYKNGKRIAKELPTVEDYYPEVIPADIFYKVQLELLK